MKGSEIFLLSFMSGHQYYFEIPVYQRNYDWRKANCARLFDDLLKIIQTGKQSSHFFGSIVCVYDDDNPVDKNEYLIIDGQQRITTVSLLLLAMYNLLQSGAVVSQSESRADQIFEVYLVEKFSSDGIKLKLNKEDNYAYKKLFGDPDNYEKNSNLTINYNYFYDRIRKDKINIDDLFEAVKRLEVVIIKLNSDDNPQLIFESLNSTGLALTEGDKIRNYVLMNQTKRLQNKFYNDYWEPIEKATDHDVSAFVRDYLSVKTTSLSTVNNVYVNFRNYVEKNEIETEELLRDMLKYAKYYEILIKPWPSENGLKSKLDDRVLESAKRLNWLETTVTRPFFLEVFRLFFENSLTLKNLHDIFETIENYLFRRSICDVPTNALSKIFLDLNKDIMRYDGSYDNYVEKMKYTLLSKKESGRFPDDDEFRTALSEKDVYHMGIKYRTYLFERYENYGNLEVKNIYKGIENGIYSVEHIMPQHLTHAWIEDLGEDYERIHETWLHRIANLTLTAYNSNYSNETFDVKKNLEGSKPGIDIGFIGSGLKMNQWIAGKDKWTEEELIERDKHMCDLAQNIWSYPQTDFKPAVKPMDTVSLDEGIDLTGRKISKISYKGVEYPVKSWVDAYVKILQILHHQDESVLTDLAYSDDNKRPLSIHVSIGSESFISGAEVADNIYIWTGIGTNFKINNLLKFFKLYNADPGDLVFYLKDQEEKSSGDAQDQT